MQNFSLRFYHSDFIVLCFSGFILSHSHKNFIVAPEVWFLLDEGKICKKWRKRSLGGKKCCCYANGREITWRGLLVV